MRGLPRGFFAGLKACSAIRLRVGDSRLCVVALVSWLARLSIIATFALHSLLSNVSCFMGDFEGDLVFVLNCRRATLVGETGRGLDDVIVIAVLRRSGGSVKGANPSDRPLLNQKPFEGIGADSSPAPFSGRSFAAGANALVPCPGAASESPTKLTFTGRCAEDTSTSEMSKKLSSGLPCRLSPQSFCLVLR